MNLKEAFRYQKFLDGIMSAARQSIQSVERSMKVTRRHLKSKTNPDESDIEEEVDYGEFFLNDDVLKLILLLIDEKFNLSVAIQNAKSSANIDIDAAIESNKYRQSAAYAIKQMMKYVPSTRKTRNTDYKFNVDGNQVQYYYDVEIVTEDNFDRDNAKRIAKNLVARADRISSEIDSVIINTEIEYTPMFDVNSSFNEVMEEFLNGLHDGIYSECHPVMD